MLPHPSPTRSTAPVRRAEPRPALPQSWEYTWFSLLQTSWASLAIVPAERGVNALEAVHALAAVGRAYQEHGIHVIDATRITPEEVAHTLRACNEAVATGGRVIVATSAPSDHPASIPIARAMDAAVLAIRLGTVRGADARHVTEVIGASRFIGALVARS